MEGVTIIETAVIKELINKIEGLETAIKQATKDAKVKDPTMTLREVAEYLKKSYGWVVINKHNIGCSNIGGDWLTKQSIVDEYINSTFHKN